MSSGNRRIIPVSVGVEPSNFVSLGALLALAYYLENGSQSWIPLVLGVGVGFLAACVINAFFTEV